MPYCLDIVWHLWQSASQSLLCYSHEIADTCRCVRNSQPQVYCQRREGAFGFLHNFVCLDDNRVSAGIVTKKKGIHTSTEQQSLNRKVWCVSPPRESGKGKFLSGFISDLPTFDGETWIAAPGSCSTAVFYCGLSYAMFESRASYASTEYRYTDPLFLLPTRRLCRWNARW